MNALIRWMKVALGFGLCVAFLLSQRSAPRGGDDEKVEGARRDALSVVTAISRLIDDCGQKQIGKRIPADLDVLVGAGDLPRACPGSTEGVRKLLSNNDFGVDGWSGPYLDALNADPWGNAFVVTVVGLRDGRQRVWVLSAGRNGRLETTARDGAPHGDDIALLARW